jgi:hypothetical protein
MDIRIVIAHRGFVYVGEYTRSDSYVTINRAHNVRRWGTTKGLGQLAADGPRENTRLDPSPAVELHELAVINTIRCNPEKWADALGR